MFNKCVLASKLFAVFAGNANPKLVAEVLREKMISPSIVCRVKNLRVLAVRPYTGIRTEVVCNMFSGRLQYVS
jgi:hypothetical protein